MHDHMSGRSRGFGFITFEEDQSAYTVFREGMMHIIKGKRVEVKPATPKGSGSQVGKGKASFKSEQGRTSGEFFRNNFMSPYYPGMQGQAYVPYGVYPYVGRPENMSPGGYPSGMQYSVPGPYMMLPGGYGNAVGAYNSFVHASSYANAIASSNPMLTGTMETGPANANGTVSTESGDPGISRPAYVQKRNVSASSSRSRDSTSPLEASAEHLKRLSL